MSTKKIHAKLPLDKARAYEIEDWGRVTPLFKATRLIANPTYVYFIGQQDGPLIRDGLIPIVETISNAQAAYFRDTDPEEFYLAELEQIVRKAHVDADHVAQGRDHVYLLGDNVGSRPSRI